MKQKHHKIIICHSCKAKNDLSLIMENGDYDEDKERDVIYFYCCQCGRQLSIKK